MCFHPRLVRWRPRGPGELEDTALGGVLCLGNDRTPWCVVWPKLHALERVIPHKAVKVLLWEWLLSVWKTTHAHHNLLVTSCGLKSTGSLSANLEALLATLASWKFVQPTCLRTDRGSGQLSEIGSFFFSSSVACWSDVQKGFEPSCKWG